MLVLSRSLQQKIILTVPGIGEIEITYLGNSSPYQSRIGVTAPDNVIINREEIHKKILAEKGIKVDYKKGKTLRMPSRKKESNVVSEVVNIAV